ncbi:UQCC3 factor, partial [Columbina picui]|nr:UQCC3 factor [Columbina picui]
MAEARRWLRALGRAAVPVALGALLWAAVAAGEEQRRDRIRALPELTPELLAERQRHNRLIAAALREAADTDENVARRPVPWRK